MSCEFCDKFDFTSVAVKDKNIHLAGGNTNFVECATKYPDIVKLFRHCPLCGSNLLYEVPDGCTTIEPVKNVVRVAVDSMGNRIDYAVFDDDTVVTEAAEDVIRQLRVDTGCGFLICKDAYDYAMRRNGGYNMMIAYIKAKICAVKTIVPFHTRVERFMEDIK